MRTFQVVVQRLQQKLLLSCNNYILEALNDTKLFPRRAINVIRDPVKSAIAEFHRVNTNQYGSVSEKNLVGKNMETLARKPPGHANMLINHVKLISERGLDVLYVSYEDMMDNLLPQLFRIQNFLGFEDAQSVERTFCTYLSKKEDEKITRLPKTDFVPKFLDEMDHEIMNERLKKLSTLLQTAHSHLLRLPPYFQK